MSAVRVVQLQAESAPHLRAFDEVADALAESAQLLGHDVSRSSQQLLAGAVNIVLGWHLLPLARLAELPPGTVLYNFEQLAGTPFFDQHPLSSFAPFTIWDYSEKNVRTWAEHGVEARFVPLGYAPCLHRISRTPGGQDIDVLFYGSINDRRREVLEGLARAGARVEARFGCYGAERDALIARSRVVLNISYYPGGILELVRLSYLWANGVPVVCERTADHEVPEGFDDAAVYVEHDQVVPATLELLRDHEARRALGRRAQAAIEAKPWTDVLGPALDAVAATVSAPPRTSRPAATGRTGGSPTKKRSRKR